MASGRAGAVVWRQASSVCQLGGFVGLAPILSAHGLNCTAHLHSSTQRSGWPMATEFRNALRQNTATGQPGTRRGSHDSTTSIKHFKWHLPNLIAPAIIIRAEDLLQCSLQLYKVHTARRLSEVASLQEAHLHMPNCKDTTEHGRNANIAAKQKSSPLAKRVLVTL